MILVTAPTGLVGHQIVEQLLPRNESVRVIARDPDKLSSVIRERVEVVDGSHGDPAVLERAFDGVDALFWLVPVDPKAASVHAAYVDFSRPAARAIVDSGVDRLVIVSALGQGVPGEAGFVTGSHSMDELMMSTGANTRVLALPSFMDNLARQAGAIAHQGAFYSPIAGDRAMPSCATRDIAAVAAELLTDHTWTGQEVRPVLGPEDISFNDMARVMTEVLGTEVRFRQIPPEAYKENMKKAGLSDAMAQGMLDMALAKDRGIDNNVQRTPEWSTPTTFGQWCSDVLAPLVAAARSQS